jgi:tripartite ATP-independent transporter DctM subunit
MAELGTSSLLLIVVLLALLGSGVWIAVALLAVAVSTVLLMSNTAVSLVMPSTIFSNLSSWTLTSLPLFIWMGEILFRSRLSEDLFRGIAPWVGRIPGKLLHVNVLGCALFAAVSGSSAATAATVGRFSIPELLRRGYDEKATLGSLAASGTLGLMIPPSIMMIVYGVSANVSIVRLFVAGILPGLVIVALLMGYIVIWSLKNKELIPAGHEQVSWQERWRGLRLILPVSLLIASVIGAIYGGIATATEAAALGVAGALVIATTLGGMKRDLFWASLVGATRTSCMIGFILGAAAFLTTAMGYSGIPRELAAWIGTQQFSWVTLIVVLTGVYLILGCFLDGVSIIVLTTAIILPSVAAAGIDLLWFGIYLIIVVEIAQITPPVGFNLFVIQGLTGREITYITRATVPFFLVLASSIIIICLFPEIVTVLPSGLLGE